LLVLDPAKLQRNGPPPPVVIEDVTVNNQSEKPEQIENAPPGRKDLEFRYTALSFLAPTALRFRYMLDGYDKHWTDAGTRRTAYYTNLPPGKFKFRVTACSSDGACNETGTAVAFTVAPHYYQRVWFLALCAVSLSMVAWLLWHQRVRSLNRHFEIVLGERGRIARELHDTLIQGFSGITMGMQALSKGLTESTERSRLNELIDDAAQCLKQARQSIAGLRSAGERTVRLDIAIADAARQITKASDVQLKLNLEHVPATLRSDVGSNLLRIAQEAIANSTQHSEAKTIEVDLRFRDGSLCLSVEDDGKGLVNAVGFSQTGHYGLTGMKERARQIGGELQLLSGPVKGTTIRVVVPAS
jgi:signal transduction histidine kinase